MDFFCIMFDRVFISGAAAESCTLSYQGISTNRFRDIPRSRLASSFPFFWICGQSIHHISNVNLMEHVSEA